LRKDALLSLENMRRHLVRMNSSGESSSETGVRIPVLQYVVVVDLAGAAMKTIPLDIVSWYLREVQPNYYGIIGASFITNYTWTHAGLWRLLKHVLPASAIAKVFFPSEKEIKELLPESFQSLGFSHLLEEPPDSLTSAGSETSFSSRASSIAPATTPSTSVSAYTVNSTARPRRPKLTSRFSCTNPYFGYPVVEHDQLIHSVDESCGHSAPPYASTSEADADAANLPVVRRGSSIPILRHGRRRKRDLVLALCILYWQRWSSSLSLGLMLALIVALVKYGHWATGWVALRILPRLRRLGLSWPRLK